jgi:gliding motility-associated-like protein
MSNKINIDDLLKQEMGNLSPEPPADMWKSISNQLPHAGLSPIPVSAVKTIAGVSIKSAVFTIACIAVGSVAYLFLSSRPTPPKALEYHTTKVNESLTSPTNTIKNQSSPTNQVSQKQKTPSAPNQKAIKKMVTVRGDISDEAVALDYPASGSSPIIDLVNTEQGVQIIKQQHVLENNTEKTQLEKKETPNSSSTSITTNEEFLKPNIPNVFTPNNDGYNDEFVITIENELLYDLKITDAKGNVVFESRDKNKHWNGTNQRNGETCEPGVYVLAFGYMLKGMSEPKVEKGLILLKL